MVFFLSFVSLIHKELAKHLIDTFTRLLFAQRNSISSQHGNRILLGMLTASDKNEDVFFDRVLETIYL